MFFLCVAGELLRVNDELNNVFLRYDRFERLRGGSTQAAPTSAAPAVVRYITNSGLYNKHYSYINKLVILRSYILTLLV